MSAAPLVPNNIGNYRFLTGTNFEKGITAHAGGGQANAYPITAQMSRIDTVATAGDSVVLPKILLYGVAQANNAAQGQLVFIYNNTSNPCAVYSNTNDTLNISGAGVSLSLPAGGTMVAYPIDYNQATNVGVWNAILSTSVPAGYSTDANGNTTGLSNFTYNSSVDVVVYGATPAGICAAIAASRQGASVIVIEPTGHLGGAITGGVCNTDVLNNLQSSQVTNVADEFFAEVANEYGVTQNNFFVNHYNGEPSIYAMIFRRMLKRNGIPVYLNAPMLASFKSGTTITSATFQGIGSYAASVFIDATYEGDLMAANCTYTIGREATGTYSETNAGVQALATTVQSSAQFQANCDPYNTPGVSGSGLLPFVTSNSLASAGTADGNVMAGGFRLTLCKTAQRIPINTAPSGYNAANYELLARNLALLTTNSTPVTSLAGVLGLTSLQGTSKYDANNLLSGALDYVNPTTTLAYINGTWAQRQAIIATIQNYTLGLMYWLGYSGDARIQAALVTDTKTYGLCPDEYGNNSNFSTQFYLREGRRMVGDTVFNQNNCVATNGLTGQIAVGYYNFDCHMVQYLVSSSYVKAEGTLPVPPTMPPNNGYIIPLTTLLPKVADCTNLLSVCCPSVSHMAWASVRVEPTLMSMGCGAGVCAALAAQRGVTVQSIYALASNLTQFNNALDVQRTLKHGAVVISADQSTYTAGTLTQGGTAWTTGTTSFGYIGTLYWVSGDNTSTLTIAPTFPVTGRYKLYLNYPAGTAYDASRNPITVKVYSASETATLTITEKSTNGQGGTWDEIGEYKFNQGTGSGTTSTIVISGATSPYLFGALKAVLQTTAIEIGHTN